MLDFFSDLPNESNSFANSAPPLDFLDTTKTVSSPAIVPIMLEIPELSNELARNCAPPGGVRTTAKFPDDSTEKIKSEGSGIDFEIAPSNLVDEFPKLIARSHSTNFF